LIKPFQAKGAFGERHVNKIPHLFPIPKYDPNIQSHKELAKDGITCSKRVDHIIPSLSITSVGKIRSIIRKELTSELARIGISIYKLISLAHRPYSRWSFHPSLLLFLDVKDTARKVVSMFLPQVD
jgi:hypothetical protein